MSDYKIPFIRNSFIRFWNEHEEELLEAVKRCGRSGDLILRKDVVEFEKNLSDYTNTKYAVATNSGTDALFLACKALGIGQGDEVITVAHTFIASIQCIVHCGAVPILVDVAPNELIDVSKIEAAITPRTKAILPVHFHGKVCDMDEIMRLAKKYNLYVIEDACQALGSSYFGDCGECEAGRNSITTSVDFGEGPVSHTTDFDCVVCKGTGKRWRKAGSFGDFGCFSFNTPKLMGGWGDGGGLVTNNYKLAQKVMMLRNHWNMAQTSVNMPDFPTPEVVHWAYKSRLDNIQAAMLNVKWKYYPDLLNRRKEIANLYCEGLRDTGLRLPTYGEGDVIQEFIIRMDDPKTRERFKEFMDIKGIELLVRETTPNHKVKLLGLEHFSLPVTENISTDAVRLPCYPELTNEEVHEIVSAVREFYGK